jgi:hypothetical protein
MVGSVWPELGGKELRYLDHTWALTGTVDVRDDGRLLAVAAERTADSRRPAATLFFALDDLPDALNPGALGEYFDRLERDGGHHIHVRTDGRSYRYELRRLEYEQGERRRWDGPRVGLIY